MSGLAGLWRLSGRPIEARELGSMLDAIAHRGPDGCGAWRDGPVALGHRMLHTTPESLGEASPLTLPTEAGPVTITADARIDNRDELISRLELDPRAAASVSDTELILRAYLAWGERCWERLLGDFAVAIWDGRTRQLVCARDAFGVKPLYYHHAPGRLFAFGSEIKALLALPDVPRRLNEVRVADHLVGLLEDKEITFYEGIVRLPPASVMWVEARGVRRLTYWALDPEREIRLGSDREYAERFREIFIDAVRCRLRSRGTIAISVSGGLDSSSVAGAAGELVGHDGGNRIIALTLVYPDVPECDERPYAAAVVERGAFEWLTVRGDDVPPLGGLDDARLDDEPVFGPNHFLVQLLVRAAQRSGARVLLDGFDGDTVISHGLAHLRFLARRGRFLALRRNVNALAARLERTPSDLLVRHVLRPLLPRFMREAWRTARSVVGHGPERDILRPEFAVRVGLNGREGALRRLPGLSEKEDHHSRLGWGLVPLVAEAIDRSAAGCGVDARHPFLDRRVVELCLALPPGQKIREGWTRYLLRGAMAGIVPDTVRWRAGKSDAAPNFYRALALLERDKLTSLADRPEPLASFVDVEALRGSIRRFLESRDPATGLAAWRALTLADWLGRTHLENPES